MAHRPLLGPGFRFSPTDEEMVELFLKQKILAPGFLHEMDVYSSEPWNLGVDFEFGQGRNEGFFLTPRHPSGSKGRRAKRSAGDGYWHSEGGETQILAGDGNGNGKHVVGYKTTLSFRKRDGTKWPNNEWIMHEYSLCCDDDHKGFQPKALCRIYKKAAKGGRRGATPIADDEPMMSQQEMMAELFQDDQ